MVYSSKIAQITFGRDTSCDYISNHVFIFDKMVIKIVQVHEYEDVYSSPLNIQYEKSTIILTCPLIMYHYTSTVFPMSSEVYRNRSQSIFYSYYYSKKSAISFHTLLRNFSPSVIRLYFSIMTVYGTP